MSGPSYNNSHKSETENLNNRLYTEYITDSEAMKINPSRVCSSSKNLYIIYSKNHQYCKIQYAIRGTI